MNTNKNTLKLLLIFLKHSNKKTGCLWFIFAITPQPVWTTIVVYVKQASSFNLCFFIVDSFFPITEFPLTT